MKKFRNLTLTLLLAAGISARAQSAPDASSIWGSWILFEVIYKGVVQPPFNPNLILTFDFSEDGASRLFWTRKNDPAFCERKGQYTYQNGFLIDTITWVNPKNAIDCSQDPDMQLGKTTSTELRRVDENLHLYLFLGEDPLIYVLKPQ